MTSTDAESGLSEVADLAGRVVHDAGRLLDQHGRLLRKELGAAFRDASPAAASIGAGAGFAAIGGGLLVLSLVHGLQRATRLPLWGCYGLVGSGCVAAGLGLMASGSRLAARIDLLPRESLGALREDLAWIKDTMTTPRR
ncbi:MAG: phage holin family protein [Isosphaeraceae bacterium]